MLESINWLRPCDPPTMWLDWMQWIARDRQTLMGCRNETMYTSVPNEREALRLIIECYANGLREHYPEIQVAYGGSTALWLAGQADHYGDIDLYSNIQFSVADWQRLTGLRADRVNPIGFQHWNLNLDLFWSDQLDIGGLMEVVREHMTVTDDGIPILHPDFVRWYNYIVQWFFPCKKPRQMTAPPADMEKRLVAALRHEQQQRFAAKRDALVA